MGLFRREQRALAPMEQRDPTAATKNVQWMSPGRPQIPVVDAGHAFEQAYYVNVVVYRCIQLYAATISSMPFRAGADPDKPNDFDRAAPLARLLGPPPGGPAPKLSARRLWAWTAAQRQVTGRNGWEIELDGDQIVALWPLASSSLKAIPSTGGADWFDRFLYGRLGEERTLTNDKIVYDWTPSGTDFRQPETPLRAAALDIAVAAMQSRYDYAFLRNDARPAALVVTEAFEDEDSYRAFKQQWNGEHQGPDNAGRIAFVEATGTGDQGVKGAVDVTVLGISPKDAQAAQRHLAAMERAAMALGTPWSLLDASGRTFDNAGQEWKNYVTHTVLPGLADFQDMVNMQLAPRVGTAVGWFDSSRLGILPMDRMEAQGAATLFSARVITKNEARQPFGLPTLPDGDKFDPAPVAPVKIPPPITPAASAPPPAPVALAAVPSEERKMHDYKGNGEPCAICGKPAVHQAHGYFYPRGPLPAVDGRRAVVPAPPPQIDHEERRARVWRTADGKVRNLERQWHRAMRKLFARQARSALARLEGKRGRALVRSGEFRATAGEVFDPKHWLDETIDDVTALYESVVAAGGARVSDLFGIAFDLEAPYAQDFIQARAKQLAGQVTDTTYAAIQDALREGVAEGEAIPELASRIKHVFDVASDSRATTIARTEVISAFNGSASLTANEYGPDVVGGQEWIATADSRTRAEHAERDGEIVGMDELFSGGLAYPGDPSGDAADTVNCRCTVAFLTPDEMSGRSGGRARTVETRVAAVVLRMVTRSTEDVEPGIRAALKAAA